MYEIQRDEESDDGLYQRQPMNYSLMNNFILNEMRKNKMVCDAVIFVDDESFTVHRAILCACSSYFRVLFTGFNSCSWVVESDGLYKVEIPGIRGSIMEEIVKYAYMRRCTINDDNVHELLVSADYVGTLGLVKLCKDHLASMLSTESCINIMGFARHQFLNDLYKDARNYILRCFTDVADKNKDILHIELNDFYDIINDDDLNTRDEGHVWKACLKWIDVDPDSRKQHVPYLMEAVRFGLMAPKSFIKEVKEHPYVQNCEQAKPIIVETFKFMYDLDIMNPKSAEQSAPRLAIPRLPYDIVFAIGGWNGGIPKGCVEAYDMRADCWLEIHVDDSGGSRAYHGSAAIGHKIYIIGGYNGLEYLSTCRVFDAVSKNWAEIAPMHCRRCYISVVELNGLIYAIGGYDGHFHLNSVERYNPTTNQWTMLAPMNMYRSDASACSVDGKIYATGGFSRLGCLNHAECYDPATNSWIRLPSMAQRRSGVSCVGFRGHVIVVGGFNGSERLSSGERYDPQSKTWSLIAKMHHSRSNLGLHVIEDKILAIGGFNGITTLATTEAYSVQTDKWIETSNINRLRSAFTVVTVCDLPNKRDYLCEEGERCALPK